MRKLFYLTLLLSLFVAALCPLPTTPPMLPQEQDYAVTEEWVCNAPNYYLNGVLTIEESGSITFTDTILHITGNSAEHGISVYGSASFNNAVITSTTETVGNFNPRVFVTTEK